MKNMRINAKYNYYIEEIIKYLQYEQMILDQCIFYSYWFSHNAVAIYLLKKYFKSIKIVSRAHSTDIYEWNLRWQSLFPLYNISRKMDKIFFISDHARKYFLNMKNNLLIDNTVVSRLGVKEFRSIGIMKNRETLRIVSVSNIISLKRIDLIIDALAVTNEKIEWRHIGEGMQSADIKEYAHEKLSGINNVKYKFEGYVPNKKLNQYYINYKPHVLINTTKREGIPVTIMEIMSYGIPVIAMNVGAVREIVTNRNGVLLKNNSGASKIAAALSYIKHLSEDEYERMCRNARKTFLERYSADNNYKKFIDRLIQL